METVTVAAYAIISLILGFGMGFFVGSITGDTKE